MAKNMEISNDWFSAEISSFGAELQSLKNRQTGEEYIWQCDPEVWEGSAPILFPVVGRMKNDSYRFEGKTYQMPLHGFAWKSEFECVEHGNDHAVFTLKDSPETWGIYPFSFELRVGFRLSQKGLSADYTVLNPAGKPLWFTLGSHPAFALQTAPENYRIRFSRKETLDLYGIRDGLLEKIQTDYLKNESVILLHAGIFKDDALIFLDIASDSIRLEAKDGSGITVKTGGAPHIGFWAKPNAPYVCIEPWYSVDEAADHDGELTHRPGIIKLDAIQTWEASCSIIPFYSRSGALSST